MVKCCMVPGRSQNRTSTYSMCSSLASLKMSSGVLLDTEHPFCLVKPRCRRRCHNSRTPGRIPHPGRTGHRRLLGREIFPGGIGGDAAVDDKLRARRIGGFVARQEEDEIGYTDRLGGGAGGRPCAVGGREE